LWAAIVARDRTFDGSFVFGVVTTGIYCRPSCPARHAKRENIRFHATCADAERAGFRPCKRCKPNQPSLHTQYAAKVAKACRMIESAEEAPPLDELARAAGLSPHHFHRIFKSIAGVTPKAYATAHRHSRVREQLKRSRTVTEAIHSSGFNSNGRFYANAPEALGMTPSDFRAGGQDVRMTFAVSKCSLGFILVAATDKGVAAIFLGDDRDALEGELKDRFPRAEIARGDRDFARLVTQVVDFVETPQAGFDLPLDIRGTSFQHRVWAALREIPAGSTATYAEIAKRIGKPKSVRAVGSACGANPVAVVVPCHRVVRADGGLSGYRWGTARKRALLAREKRS
jgi:AraC family transcriptional regulator of adaptative response/methylated-DNA-[protein]-cysteine methyltransferase